MTERERGRRRIVQKGNSRTKREESGQETVRSRTKGWESEEEDRDEATSGQKGPKAKKVMRGGNYVRQEGGQKESRGLR